MRFFVPQKRANKIPLQECQDTNLEGNERTIFMKRYLSIKNLNSFECSAVFPSLIQLRSAGWQDVVTY